MIMENVDFAHEMMVVGGMIQNPERCADFAIASLQPDSFADPDIGALFQIIADRYRSNESVMSESLIVDLRKKIGVNAIRLMADLIEKSFGFDHWNFPYYVSRVQDLSLIHI